LLLRGGFLSIAVMRRHDLTVARALPQAYLLMRRHYGHQGWWPGDDPFEVCVGAILTQNTNWRNVERAIQNLKTARVLAPDKLHALPLARLADLIRPAGYFNVKARRLHDFLEVLNRQFEGRLEVLFKGPTSVVRKRLLNIRGIGPETADSMLLYAGGHLSFVVDAYTRRIFSRHGWCKRDADYDSLQRLCAEALPGRSGQSQLDYWQDYHAQLVNVGKDHCRTREPKCQDCPLRPLLPQNPASADNLLVSKPLPDI
jgi:endonuclease III related protein